MSFRWRIIFLDDGKCPSKHIAPLWGNQPPPTREAWSRLRALDHQPPISNSPLIQLQDCFGISMLSHLNPRNDTIKKE